MCGVEVSRVRAAALTVRKARAVTVRVPERMTRALELRALVVMELELPGPELPELERPVLALPGLGVTAVEVMDHPAVVSEHPAAALAVLQATPEPPAQALELPATKAQQDQHQLPPPQREPAPARARGARAEPVAEPDVAAQAAALRTLAELRALEVLALELPVVRKAVAVREVPLLNCQRAFSGGCN